MQERLFKIIDVDFQSKIKFSFKESSFKIWRRIFLKKSFNFKSVIINFQRDRQIILINEMRRKDRQSRKRVTARTMNGGCVPRNGSEQQIERNLECSGLTCVYHRIQSQRLSHFECTNQNLWIRLSQYAKLSVSGSASSKMTVAIASCMCHVQI